MMTPENITESPLFDCISQFEQFLRKVKLPFSCLVVCPCVIKFFYSTRRIPVDLGYMMNFAEAIARLNFGTETLSYLVMQNIWSMVPEIMKE